MIKIELAVQQAIHKINQATALDEESDELLMEAVAALREALAETEITTPDVCGEVCARAKLCYGCGKALDEANAKLADHVEQSLIMVAEPVKQEPVAYMFKVKRTLPSSTPLDVFAAIEYHPLPHEDIISKEPLYAAPVRTKDLTDLEIADIVYEMNGNEPTATFWRDLARAVIAKDREKNRE